MRLLLLILLAIPLFAAASLEQVNLGSHILGPKVTAEDLKGRVVLFEYWGVNCPPCRASIKHLAAWQKEYDRDTFLIVANHCQGGPADNIRKVWQENGGGDGISVIDNGGLAGADVSGIPRCFLFDHEGRLAFDGSPFEVEAALKKAVEASPGQLVAGYTWNKLKKEAFAIGKRQGMAMAIKSVRKQAESSDEAAKTEAVEMLRRLDAWTGKMTKAMNEAKPADPVEAFRVASTMSTALKGDVLAAAFDAVSKELLADKTALNAIKGADALEKVKALATRYGLAGDPDGWMARASNKGKAQEIAGGLRTVITKFAGTRAATEAQELAKTWKFGS